MEDATVRFLGEVLGGPAASPSWAPEGGGPGPLPSPQPHPPGGPPHHSPFSSPLLPLSPWAVLLTLALLLANAGASWWLRLGLERVLATACFRCVIQLGVLGYMLQPLLQTDWWWLVILAMGVLVAVATAETVSQVPAAHKGLFLHVAGSLGGCAVLATLYVLGVAIRPVPRWAAAYALPVLGVLLTASISAVSLALASVFEQLTAGREEVELRLSLGASRWEAVQPVLRQALATALTPGLTHVAVAGLVGLPPFMAGQMAAGASPVQAARYEAVVLLASAAAAGLASLGAVIAALLTLVDSGHRLRCEKLTYRPPGSVGIAAWLQDRTAAGFWAAHRGVRKTLTRLRIAHRQSAGWGPVRRQEGGGGYRQGTRLGRRGFGSVGDEEDEESGIGQLRSNVVHGEGDDESVFSGAPLSEDGRDPSLSNNLDDALLLGR